MILLGLFFSKIQGKIPISKTINNTKIFENSFRIYHLCYIKQITKNKKLPKKFNLFNIGQFSKEGLNFSQLKLEKNKEKNHHKSNM